jgi:hypothetical protein
MPLFGIFKNIINDKRHGYFMQDSAAADIANFSIHILNKGFED